MTGLETLKNNVAREYLYLVISDNDIKKVILGWTLYGATGYKEPASLPKDIHLLTETLWQTLTDLDYNHLADMAGISRQAVMGKFPQLARARLVFPDGTAASEALAIIRGEVGTVIRSMARPKEPQ